ncbi:MAG: hypothetical protein JST51_19320 [Armatimonadetes bacterium]|nr:hypothetical protein [Armatimonadota bacterium]
MAVSLVALVGFARLALGQQDLARQITLDAPVSRATLVVDRLSAVTGIPMNAVGPVGDEILFVHAESRPIREIMDKIASVTKGEWHESRDHAWALIRTNEMRKKEEDQEFGKLTQTYRHQLDSATRDFPETYDAKFDRSGGRAYLRSVDLGQSTEMRSWKPLERALSRGLSHLDAATLAQLQPDERIVFSTCPTASQRGLDPMIASKLESENRLWKSELASMPVEGPNGKCLKNLLDETTLSYQSYTESERADPEPYVVTMTIVYKTYGERYVDLNAYDRDGHDIGSTGLELSLEDDDSELEIPSWSKKLVVPPPSATLVAFWGSGRFTDDPKCLDDLVHRSFLHDGLALGNQELLASLGQQLHKNIVACVPDWAMVTQKSSYGFKSYLDPDDMTWAHCSSQDWLELYPYNYTEHWQSKCDRKLIGPATSTFDMRTYVGLTCGQLGYDADALSKTIVDRFYGYSSTGSHCKLPEEPCVRHLFASLTEVQLSKLMNGEILSYRSLTPAQLEMAKRYLLSPPDWKSVGGSSPDLWSEDDPTFELKNGIYGAPGIGLITSDDVVCGTCDPAKTDRAKIEIGVTDRPEVVDQRNSCVRSGSEIYRSDLFQIGHQRRWTLRFYFSPTHWYAADFLEPSQFPDSRLYGYRELSPATRELIERNAGLISVDQLKKFKASFESMLANMNSANIDPKEAQGPVNALNDALTLVNKELSLADGAG